VEVAKGTANVRTATAKEKNMLPHCQALPTPVQIAGAQANVKSAREPEKCSRQDCHPVN
jgi:hypothetical protein